eukprot:CAMPEP_0174850246 /NCGR_PEP_ID=MMETSP1114-20130205/19120_1 /TAXON_ID=312471 /ORGANISM="Neobodo designis, Strain CCAP 1951/1" /LENGTH=280 /DNA_ID=CAMNT_0016084687 /DNA_START=33 /DNA_END=875 /DNA_ORIENTATION=-
MFRLSARRACAAATASASSDASGAASASSSSASAGGGGRSKPTAGPGNWRDAGVYVEQPEFFGEFFTDEEAKRAEFAKKQPPLKTYDEYMQMDIDKLKKLNDIRTQQIQELKLLHERSHRNVEYFYRKQSLEYDEKALNYGEAAGSLAMDQISYHRRRLGELREKNWMDDREKVLVLWICFFIPCFWWLWLLAHYPKKPTIDNKGSLTSSWRAWCNPLTTESRWIGKNVLTAWEKEMLEKDPANSNMSFKAHGNDSVMAPGTGYRVTVKHTLNDDPNAPK